MTWKRGLFMALCGCALWLYADRTARAQDGPPKGDKPPRAERPKDAPPPGAPRDRRGPGPRDEEFAPPGPPPGEFGPPGPQPFDERIGPPGRPRPNREGDRPMGPGMQGPPGDKPQGMPGGPGEPGVFVERTYEQRGRPGMLPGQGYGPWMGGGFGGPGMMRRQDPDLVKEAELDRQVQELAEAFRRHPADAPEAAKEREKIQKEIEKLVNEQFNLRQERREKELKLFEEQIKRLRETIEKRQKAREEIIERRMKELLGQDDDMRF
ncbi:MAG: hypothetical protein IT426_05770 [Pirellulales bacterium]|nr:hypothetical protein [Pirellulales bacterium]